MATDQESIEGFRQNAETVVEMLSDSGAPSDFGEEALKWLETYALKRRPYMDADESETLIWLIGAFLGECMCRTYGGRWVKKEGQWAISIEQDRWIALPFSKVAKVIHNGPEESFVTMFTMTPRLLDQGENDSKE